MLEALGLFVGQHKEPNHEATFFLAINRWLLAQTGGAWDNPAPIHYLLENRGMRSKVGSYITNSLLESPRVISFLGLAKYVRYRSAYELQIPWGWKDPRNTFTLPIWLDLFPTARIIWIQRSREEVAASLMRRESAENWRARLYGHLGRLHWIRPKQGPFGSPRCQQLEGARSLWQEYMSEATANLSSLKRSTLVLRFEDLLSDPLEGATALARFCELQLSAAKLDSVAAIVRRRPQLVPGPVNASNGSSPSIPEPNSARPLPRPTLPISFPAPGSTSAP
jgi:hypothetical protein